MDTIATSTVQDDGLNIQFEVLVHLLSRKICESRSLGKKSKCLTGGGEDNHGYKS